jgi:uncharacterized membrane protein
MAQNSLDTLAQLFLWRLELRAVSTVIAGVGLAVIVLVTWAFGVDAGVAVMLSLFGIAALFVVYAIARFLWLLVSPAARDREVSKAEAEYAREMAAIQRDMQV